jgi:small membrane protein
MIFTGGQIVLLAAIAFFVVYAFRFRTELRDRVIYLLVSCGGIVLILAPRFANEIANRFGIGRGADLILYTFVVFTLFHNVTVSSQLRKTERQITALVRRSAIVDARVGTQDSVRQETIAS